MSIHTPNLRPPEPQRHHDVILMDYILQHYTSPTTIRRLNRCRIFLQAETLADLTNATGDRIHPNAWHCTARQPSFSDWPHQPFVGDIHRKTWKSFLTRLCHPRSPYRLRRRLGLWFPPSRTGRRWPAYHDAILDTTYIYIPAA